MRSMLLLIPLLCALVSCTSQRREQYYMVVEPGEQTAAIYKVTAKLAGSGPVDYKLNEGYVPMNVIDALSGKVGEPPDLFSAVSDGQRRAALSEKLDEKRDARLLALAETGPGPGAIQQVEETTRFFGALKHAAALTNNEQISVGQSNSTDVYGYRKLVFYASARVIPLQQFEQELNEIEKSSSDLAKAVVQARQEAAERAKARRDRLGQVRRRVIEKITERNPDVTQWTAADFLSVFGAAAEVTP